MSRLHAVRANFRITFVTIMAIGLLVMSMGRGDSISEIRLAAGAHEQDLVRWELTHFMDKWLHQLGDILRPGFLDDDERLEIVAEYFDLGESLNRALADLNRTLAAGTPGNASLFGQAQIDAIVEQRAERQAVVEETLEGAISRAVEEMGIIGGIGALKWPPVDFTFERGALLLVRSPRDRIARLDDLLLDPGVSVLDQVKMENDAERLSSNTSALVVRIGGVATYPAQVSPNQSLHGTLVLASHEWLHHWLIFKPLGKQWFAGGELQSINETVANIFGEEAGDRAYEILTGQDTERQPWEPPIIQARAPVPEDVFDYGREMRRTRAHLEELLAADRLEEADDYLEERRLEFVANGYYIRELNTAWFAFFGTYADSAASISPIEGQLRAIRADSDSLAEFLQRVAIIEKPGELERLALEAGWVPIDTSTGLPLQ